MGHNDPALLSQLSRGTAPLARQLSPQHLSNIIWAMAKLGHSHPGLLAALVPQLIPAAPRLDASMITSVLWSLGKLDCRKYDDAVHALAVQATQVRFWGIFCPF